MWESCKAVAAAAVWGGDKNKIHLRNIVSCQLLHNVAEIFLPKKRKLCWTRNSVEPLFSASLALNQTPGFIFVSSLWWDTKCWWDMIECQSIFFLFFFSLWRSQWTPVSSSQGPQALLCSRVLCAGQTVVVVVVVVFFCVHSNHSVIWLLQPVKMIYNIF